MCGGGSSCRVLVDCEPGDALLLPFGYFIGYGEDHTHAHGAGRETATSHQERGELDSSRNLLRHPAISKFLSSRRAGRASDIQRLT